MIEPNSLVNADCLVAMDDIADKSVGLLLADLPYGTTRNSWDIIIPFEPMWNQFNRVITDNGAIVLFSQQPFTAKLIMSNPKMFKYEWIWVKDNSTGFLNCKFAPLKIHENILVFSKSASGFVKDTSKAMTYNPQMGTGKPYKAKQGGVSSNYDMKHMRRYMHSENHGTRYPIDVIKYGKVKHGMHPTEKPVDLLRYLVRTYSNEGDLVLDPCCGSGATCEAAQLESRQYIGIELNPEYYEYARQRLNGEKEESEKIHNLTIIL